VPVFVAAFSAEESSQRCVAALLGERAIGNKLR
jgi:hypothetical protein